MEPLDPSTTRRLLLGSSIAAVGGAVSVATAGPAAAAVGPGPSSGEPAAAPAVAAALPAVPAGQQTLYFGPLGWTSYSNAAGASVIYLGATGSRASTGYLGQSLMLPPGSTITGLDFTLRGPGAVSGSVFLMQASPDTSGAWSSVASVSAAAVGTTSVNLSIGVTTTTSFSLECVLGADSYVSGVRVRYTPPTPSGLNLVPITPARVYDSRLNMAPDANGVMGPGSNRTISVAGGRNPSTGAVTTANVVPSSATGLAFILTVTGTTGAGFLAVNPGGDTVVHASAINWASGQTIANSGIVAITSGRTITLVRGGSGNAQVLVDVVGYYVR